MRHASLQKLTRALSWSIRDDGRWRCHGRLPDGVITLHIATHGPIIWRRGSRSLLELICVFGIIVLFGLAYLSASALHARWYGRRSLCRFLDAVLPESKVVTRDTVTNGTWHHFIEAGISIVVWSGVRPHAHRTHAHQKFDANGGDVNSAANTELSILICYQQIRIAYYIWTERMHVMYAVSFWREGCSSRHFASKCRQFVYEILMGKLMRGWVCFVWRCFDISFYLYCKICLLHDYYFIATFFIYLLVSTLWCDFSQECRLPSRLLSHILFNAHLDVDIFGYAGDATNILNFPSISLIISYTQQWAAQDTISRHAACHLLTRWRSPPISTSCFICHFLFLVIHTHTILSCLHWYFFLSPLFQLYINALFTASLMQIL